mmetsp:Transcript_9709/g.14696  ORF Transcript_9709/g.14696 Transcript_9709/m.14696 type:complete len:208 (-) Transcript_9709:133-756(-)|eukprot:CAMPEP_0201511346 /NCGR_PEP_ID=MMETSP0161_2-20130828/3817_1 /ASSEMBLY_ACC=CAM_ASM_000251 /TAXON_ID=180227 /ORGANISM="Neoparamoeba aestuarina, Strain SoJaBio B1-5/56/2" /LENGTH=207 /DNA_ID=CAMNT_0047906807 /DNA_START=135 /DNA_END=758 /DNA_ORIENTATION=+
MGDANASKHYLKVVVLGESSVGKTCLMTRFIRNSYQPIYRATIGADFLSKRVEVDEHVVSLQVWDTAGQERFQGLGTAYFRGADACLLVFDVTVEYSFQRLSFWKKTFLEKACIPMSEQSSFPFVVVGNKVDEPNHAVTEKAASDWCEENGCIGYVEASAKEGTGVDKAFYDVCSRVLKKRAGDDWSSAVSDANVVSLGEEKDKGCC